MTFSDPPSIHRFDDRTCKQDLWAQSLVPFDSSSIEVERVSYRSKDGTYVPMFLVAKKGSLRLGPLPTVLTGYGGFGVPMTPQFSVVTSFLVEHGCLVAVANVRGGSELGAEWHLAAKRQKRQNAFNDFLAAGEWLIAGGHTATDTLAIAGGSNAGLLVGAALTQKPEMFRAAICLGPLLDMLRYHIFDNASWWVDEYGSATNVDDFAALREYSPYQRVQEGVAYPAVMLISGDADTRCNPMHARKMAARLQGATSSGRPVLLDYKMKWGHYPVLPLSERVDAVADRLTFLCHEIGVHL
jgi:prolyl oligopeptidase